MSDRDRILAHLKEHGNITQDEARALFGCNRLASRIHELRDMGFSIQTEMIYGKDRFDEPMSYARYHFRRENDETV